jgi:hypothetical protein
MVLIAFIIVTLATFACSTTLATTPLLDSFRRRLYEKSAMWGKLFSCPYCLSHWISAIFVGVSGPDLIKLMPHTNPFIAWALISYAVVGLCAILDVFLDLKNRVRR